MTGFFASAMITIMALVVFGAVIPLGGVNPLLLSPAFGLVVLLAVIWTGKVFLGKEVTWSHAPIHWPVIGFVAYSVFRYFTTPIEYEARGELFQIGLCALVYFVAAHQFHHRRDRTIFLVALMILAVFESAYAMWQAFTHSDAILLWERPEGYVGRGSGTYVCPNHLAGFLELALGLTVARAVIVRRESQSTERSVLLKVLIVYVAVMTAAGIVVTLSRSGWVSAVVGLSALFFLGEWRWRSSLSRAAVVLAVLAFMAFMLWNVDPIRNYLVKSLSVGDKAQGIPLSDPTIGGRVLMWKGTLKMIGDAPLLGTGIGSWQWVYQRYKDPRISSEPDYTHNDYLNLAADYGLIGVTIMLVVFGCFFWHAGRIARSGHTSEQRAFAVGAILSVISILVHSWFDFNLHIPANSLLLAAIMGFTAAMGERPRPMPASPFRRYVRILAGAGTLVVSGIMLRFFVPTLLAFQHTSAGNAAKIELDYATAISHYERAAALDPNYPRPLIKIGEIHLSSANWRKGPAKAAERRELAHKAIDAYDRALAVNRYQAFVHVAKGQAHELAGEDELALQSYQQAIAIAPFNAYAHYRIGCFHRDRGADEKAYEAFNKASEFFHYTDETFNLNYFEAYERRSKAQPK